MDRKKAAKALKNGVGILLLAALVFAACRVAAGRRPRVKVYEVKTSGVVFDAAEGDFSDAGGPEAGA